MKLSDVLRKAYFNADQYQTYLKVHEAADLLDECERVLSSIYTDAVQYTYPTCKRTVLKCEATLAKLRSQDKAAQEKTDE